MDLLIGQVFELTNCFTAFVDICISRQFLLESDFSSGRSSVIQLTMSVAASIIFSAAILIASAASRSTYRVADVSMSPGFIALPRFAFLLQHGVDESCFLDASLCLFSATVWEF